MRLRLPATGVRSDDEARAFYERMTEKYVEKLRKPGATRFGEKTPEHTGHLDRIRHLFPKAKIIVLYRDGRDVALSLTKTPWAPAGLYANFVIWLYYQSIILRVQSQPNPNLQFVRYEDVVDRPEESFHEMLTFLGLPYETSVTEGCGNRDGIPSREYSWKATALEKITADRMGGVPARIDDRSGRRAGEQLGRHTLTTVRVPAADRRCAPVVAPRTLADLLRPDPVSRESTVVFGG